MDVYILRGEFYLEPFEIFYATTDKSEAIAILHQKMESHKETGYRIQLEKWNGSQLLDARRHFKPIREVKE